MLNQPPPQYQVVLQQGSSWPARLRWLAVALLWPASLLAVWYLVGAGRIAGVAPSDPAARAAGKETRELRAQLAELGQRDATLVRSDQISRQANRELQASLAERDEEIAGLRADVAFYERLVGPTAKRQGLNVFSSEFDDAGGGAWKYRIVLTQNLNRGAISAGRMRFAIEGMRDGRLATLDWTQLHQKSDLPEQAYSFRYFQQLEGSVMLPEAFVPQRVRVSLRGDGVALERDFDWKVADPRT